MQRLQGDFELLKRNTKSQLSDLENNQASMPDPGMSAEQLAEGLNGLQGDAMERITKMIQRVENNLNRRLNNAED